MRKNYLYTLGLGLFMSFSAIAQFPSPYCEINEDYWGVEEITTISFDGLPFTNTNTTDILVDHTAVFVEVERGESYTISLKGNTHGNYENEFVVFVDWNQNGILDDTGEVYYIGMISNSSGSDTQAATASISVPGNAQYGSTRARITKTYTDSDSEVYLNIDPCYISYDWFGIEGSYGQAIDITVNVLCDEIPTPSGDVTQEFTPGQTLADLDVTGQGLTWFTDEDLENLIEPSLPLEHGATYYVVSTDGICQSVALAITVTDMCFEFETPTGDVTQEFIPSQTLADLDISGEGLVWFADSDLEEELEDSTLLEHGMTYYVVSTNDNCQSEPLAITVTDICFDFETPIGEVSQEFNSGETLNDLEVDGEGLTWYAGEDLSEMLNPMTTMLEDGVTYYVTASNEFCESDALAITVTENLSTVDFGGAVFSYYPNPVSDVLYLNTTDQIDSVVIYNMLGQKIQEIKQSSTIDMTDLSKGNYLVNVTIGNTTKTIRIVKQ